MPDYTDLPYTLDFSAAAILTYTATCVADPDAWVTVEFTPEDIARFHRRRLLRARADRMRRALKETR